MPKSCVAWGCTNHNLKSHISFHSFPVNPERRKRWIVACKRVNDDGSEWIPSKYAVLCGAHFLSGKPSKDPTHPDYIPTLFSYSKEGNKKDKMERFQRNNNKRRKLAEEFDVSKTTIGLSNTDNDICDQIDITMQPNSNDNISTANYVTELPQMPENEVEMPCLATFPDNEMPVSSQPDYVPATDDTETDVKKEREMFNCEINQLRKERNDLQEQLKRQKLYAESMSDEKVKFYTGLPNYGVFKLVLQISESCVLKSRTHLTLSDELLMTLMKLRFNLSTGDLAFRFQVSSSSISVIFHKWLKVLSIRLKPFIAWVPKETVMETLPAAFKNNFKFCRGIFDCSEIYVEQPVRRKTRAQTWSNYKKHNTVKFFINVTPRGLISFISRGYGGRISDKEITLQCGILDLVDPTDVYLADRGFQKEVQEAFAVKGATVITPAFTKGSTQMSASDVEKSRKISNVRIHVERVIGLLKNKYQILKGPLPISSVRRACDDDTATIDKILIVCAALCNLGEGIVL